MIPSPWRSSLRMARRDLRRHKARAVLSLLLVTLPVLVATVVSLFVHNTQWQGEQLARTAMGGADAIVEITPFTKAKSNISYGDLEVQQASKARRPIASVHLNALLPKGSRASSISTSEVSENLESGGVAHVNALAAGDPMTKGLFTGLSTGRAPKAADEVAVGKLMAKALGLLTKDGALRPDATLKLGNGTVLHVVGLLKPDSDQSSTTATRVVVSPSSPIAPKQVRWLVDLPTMSTKTLHTLAKTLAAHGIAMMPRDAIYHPQSWEEQPDPPAPVDMQAVAIGALVILIGLVEVLLLVGSAFAVGARRQVRDLGLLAASGGARSDVRRTLLAQGAVLGIGGAVLGAVGGMALFPVAVPAYESLTHKVIWSHHIAWSAVIGIVVLGSVTGLVAALIPAWSIGRLTPVAALSGRFPVRSGESRAHRGAFVLAGLGLVVLAVGGWWTAVVFNAPADQDGNPPSPLPVVMVSIGFLMLVAGVVWASPYAVRRLSGLGRGLPLTGRFAFRDAARHRFRSAAAALALTITVAGALLGGFAMNSVSAAQVAGTSTPPNTLTIRNQDDGLHPTGKAEDAAVDATVRSVVGRATTHRFYTTFDKADPYGGALVGNSDDDYTSLGIVNEDTLNYLLGKANPTAIATYRAGGVITTVHGPLRHGRIGLAMQKSTSNKPTKLGSLPALVVDTKVRDDTTTTWASPAVAAKLGLKLHWQEAVVTIRRPVTNDDLTALTVRGLDNYSQDPVTTTTRTLGLYVAGAAGLLTALIAGIVVALSAAEGRSDTATLAAVGAGPHRRRMLGAAHGLFLGIVGGVLGLAIGLPAGLSFSQLDGLSGTHVPWLDLVALLIAVPIFAALAGWLVTPIRLPMVRRAE